MPVFAGLFTSVFSVLVGFFVQWFSKKVALGLAAVAVFSLLTTTFMIAIGSLFGALISYFPTDSAILMGLWVAVPDNMPAALSAVIAADTAIALYRWNVENLRLMSYIT